MSRRVRLVRKVAFAAGHRYWLSERSAEENRRLFGQWASPYNHGHNFVLEVVTEGPVDPLTGMVVNIKDIDTVLRREVVGAYDLKSLNDEVPDFADEVPCLENMLHAIRDRLAGQLDGVDLASLTLYETPDLWAKWEEGKLTLTRSYEFAASHRLHAPGLSDAANLEVFGKCNNPKGHGHNYVVEVEVTGEPDPVTGMIVDLAALDRVVEAEVLSRYDHKCLNDDVAELVGQNPTSEVVALAIFDRLRDKIPGRLVAVRLHETARSAFEVREP
ncbi:MAG TPA: 6-carboxytetrahydropterin synthase [Fimbriimonadaceae bacterium]|nr:6-carboxytetrahydropterin synthase [Fimbriimonadaceae bacterium]HRJ96061.1 6-carboxytetrahydropterin synthase [Fimbriimonadaceae bacterium]